jgi:hypothetical protein
MVNNVYLNIVRPCRVTPVVAAWFRGPEFKPQYAPPKKERKKGYSKNISYSIKYL